MQKGQKGEKRLFEMMPPPFPSPSYFPHRVGQKAINFLWFSNILNTAKILSLGNQDSQFVFWSTLCPLPNLLRRRGGGEGSSLRPDMGKCGRERERKEEEEEEEALRESQRTIRREIHKWTNCH